MHFSKVTNLPHNLKQGCLMVGIIHVLAVPAIVIAFHTFSMQPIVHRDPCQKFRNLLLQGTLGRCQGITFYEGLSKDQLRMELEKRTVKDYPGDKEGRWATLKDSNMEYIGCLLCCCLPQKSHLLKFTCWASYCVLPCEPLHNLIPEWEPQKLSKSTLSIPGSIFRA